MKSLAFAIILCVFHLSYSVNTGRVGDLRREIAFGEVVDYAITKLNYPFMSRLIFDDLKCGGALISDRYYNWSKYKL